MCATPQSVKADPCEKTHSGPKWKTSGEAAQNLKGKTIHFTPAYSRCSTLEELI